jgi:hypothetical protein
MVWLEFLAPVLVSAKKITHHNATNKGENDD